MAEDRYPEEVTPVRLPAEEILGHLLDAALADHMDANRRLALRAGRIVEAIDTAVRHPYVYTSVEGRAGSNLAERAVIVDIALRLQLSERAVQDVARLVRDARARLPMLWQRAEEGFLSLSLVESAVTGAARLLPPFGACDDERAVSAAALRELDSRAEEWAVTVTPAGFRSRLARLLDTLDARTADARHTAALRDRKVLVEHVGDGMAWVSALVPSIDAVAIKRRLTATAKHLATHPHETRSRDQIRADLLSAWARGIGTPTAVKTKVFVTIPATLLASSSKPGRGSAGGVDQAGASTGAGADVRAGLGESATIVGHGPLSPLAAKQIFLDTNAFHRIITDPISGVILDMDRRTYRPTTAQRDWLTLQHGTCARDGCTRLALDADIDHTTPWAHGGPTNIRQLRPLCPPDHTHRHRTKLAYRTRDNGTVEVTTPTGFTSTEPPPF
ncbi:DUF222 domain-containing protein [Microbacterium sp. NPDC055910]|uniref:HNH endonuclease signature motif containing protein n=1 Tax=Microbacterium sp. NPDC055910 TaxID=3345659 RepID=UPI0035DA1643